jgi:ABC-type polar amino acid transport system ATPase subunit
MMVKLENISKSFGSNQVFHGINIAVEQGEILSLIGPSGAGKTTLLRMINWLEKPDSGSVTVDGMTVKAGSATHADIHRLRSKSSMVFQLYNLFKNKTALQNVTESLLVVKKMSKAEAEERGMELLRSVGIEDKAGEYPSRLSGGQQQRVGIARALAVDPHVMLFDEPTSALDPEWVSEVLDVIKRIADQGMTMILVSHEMRFVRDVARRVILMDGGSIIEDGPPAQIFDNPREERTRQFLRKTQDYEIVR